MIVIIFYIDKKLNSTIVMINNSKRIENFNKIDYLHIIKTSRVFYVTFQSLNTFLYNN